MANHRISSTVHDRYHGDVKAKELRSQKQEHNNMRAGLREEVQKPGLRLYDGFDKGFKLIKDSGRPHQARDRIDGDGHRHGEIDRYVSSRDSDRRELKGHNAHYQDKDPFSHGKHHGVRDLHKAIFFYDKQHHGGRDLREILQSRLQPVHVTKITVQHSVIFSGHHLGSAEKGNEAYQNFMNSALSFIQKPNSQNYKALNDSMIKLMDPRFAPAVKGGAAQVSIRNVNGTTMAKFTMEVTPAPVKSLEEAREDLKKAYSSKRDGEKDIAGIRAEAYTNYIRALSEKFKTEGKINHTNNTPTTPVFKSSVIYVVKTTKVSLQSLHELKKPDFRHNPHGHLKLKGHNSFWNDYRQNHKSYVDMLKHDPKKNHGHIDIDKDGKTTKSIGKKNHHHYDGRAQEASRHDRDRDAKTAKSTGEKHDIRHSDKGKAQESSHRHHGKSQQHGAR